MWKTVEKPSISFSNSGFTASGVTSRPVKPVPPVEMTTSMSGSPIHGRICARIASMSSLTMARATSSWPAARIISASVAPDLSSAISRVSETVSTAMRTGMNGRLGSSLGMDFILAESGRADKPGSAGLPRALVAVECAHDQVLEQAIEKVRKLPREQQEYAAEVLEQIAEAGEVIYVLSDEERQLVREGLDELDRGEVASEAEVRAVFDKYRA